jgi:hypothetical protein
MSGKREKADAARRGASLPLLTHSRLFDDPSPSRRRLLANAVAGQNATGAVEFFASILER